jgi:hypothetical protein
MKTKAEIDVELARLETLLPGLVARLEANQALEAFAAEAEALTGEAPEEHQAYVTWRINCMLAAAGLVPGETEGEPCPKGE